MKTKVQVYAVIRIDASQLTEDAITIKEILPTMEQASQEVQRLNELNGDKGVRYFWQATRYFPEGRKVSVQSQADPLQNVVGVEDLPIRP